MSAGSQRRRVALAFVVLSCVVPGVAGAAPQGNRVVELGPPVAAVYSFFQGTDGAMWMGGQQGVTRFDGARSTTFGSASIPGLGTTHAFHLQGGADDTIWIATGWGLPTMFAAPPHKGGLSGAAGLFRWRKNQWENVGASSQMPSLVVQAMFSDPHSDRVWVATDTALWVVQNNKAQIVTAAESIASEWITAIAFDKGTMWIGTTSAVHRLEIEKNNASAQLVMQAAVTKLATDRKGGVWVGTNDGLFHVDATGKSAIETQGFANRNVRDFAYDRAENLWVATLGGVCRIDSSTPLCWTEREGLPDSRIFSVYIDHDDVVWLGTRAAGVARLIPQLISTLRRGQGLEGYVAHAVTAAKNGGMWVATDSAVSLHKDHRNPVVLGTAAVFAVLIVLAIYRSKQRRQQLSLELLRQERDRMSRDLHDGMGQGFSSIGFHLEAIEESIGQSPQNLSSLRTLLMSDQRNFGSLAGSCTTSGLGSTLPSRTNA